MNERPQVLNVCFIVEKLLVIWFCGCLTQHSSEHVLLLHIRYTCTQHTVYLYCTHELTHCGMCENGRFHGITLIFWHLMCLVLQINIKTVFCTSSFQWTDFFFSRHSLVYYHIGHVCYTKEEKESANDGNKNVQWTDDWCFERYS